MPLIGSKVKSKNTGLQAVVTNADDDNITVSFVYGGEVPVPRARFRDLFEIPAETARYLKPSDKSRKPGAHILRKHEIGFDEFWQRYPLDYDLDSQQIRAVQAVEGANLVLAVPGSGKTTVLTYRLGFMTIAKGIKAQNILTITYTNAAADEMKKRLKEYFGNDIKGQLRICTINSFSNSIVKSKMERVRTAGDEETYRILTGILSDHRIRYYEDILRIYAGAVSFVKSKPRNEWDKHIQLALAERGVSKDFPQMFDEYNAALKRENLIDFNDQNNLAYEFLKDDRELLKELRDKYRYICVDEAQDTNEVQHMLIKTLAGPKGNVFMVGDDDQSIYSFNGSCPEALYSFDEEYGGATFNIETNYRSTKQIVGCSRRFIEKGATNRKNKSITAHNGEGKEVSGIIADDMMNQAMFLAEKAKHLDGKTAVLYRENNTGIILAYHLLKSHADFCIISRNPLWFSSGSFRKVLCFLRLANDPRDCEAFTGIYKEIDELISSDGRKTICGIVKKNPKLRIMDQAEIYARDYKKSYTSLVHIRKVDEELKRIKTMKAVEAVSEACRYMLDKNEFQIKKTESLLHALADNGESLESFIKKLDHLRKEIADKTGEKEEHGLILSTIHSAKGLEYDTVYLADIYDGVSPTLGSEKDDQLMAEERRIMYVAMTRARKELYIVKMKGTASGFYDDIFMPGSEQTNEPFIGLKDQNKEVFAPSGKHLFVIELDEICVQNTAFSFIINGYKPENLPDDTSRYNILLVFDDECHLVKKAVITKKDGNCIIHGKGYKTVMLNEKAAKKYCLLERYTVEGIAVEWYINTKMA